MQEFRCAPLTLSALKPDVLRITVTPFIDKLPKDVIGGPAKDDPAPSFLTLHWRDQTIETDLPTHRHNDSIRGFIRHRGDFTKALFEEGGAEVDDVIIFEQLGSHEFRLHLEKPNGSRVSGASSIERAKQSKWVERETRPEQQRFRRGVMERDGLRCVISGCEIADVLDVAHLAPRGPGGSDDTHNGIILRTDLHRLFDAGKLRLHGTGRVTLAPDVTDPEYRRFDKVVIKTGADLGNLAARGAG